MTAGPFKRLASFAIDFTLIIAVVFTSWRVFGLGILERIFDFERTIEDPFYIYLLFAYHFFGHALVNYLYQGFSQGRTLGRKFLYLRMSGQINWWSLFMREVIWKNYAWLFAITFIDYNFLYGLFFIYPILGFIDFSLMAFSRSRKTIRDHVTHTRIILDDVVYPF